jgi:tetratricopeptide (TPR) repeat protein
MGAGIDTPEACVRLQQAYANSTGEDERPAHGPIDVVLAILAAGYLSSIDPTLQPIAGMIQASARENRERLEEQFGDVHRRLEVLGPDHYVVQAHSEQAERELNLLCKQRSLTPDKVRRELIALAARVTEGDLRHVKPAIRAKVHYWTARVHATQPETLAVARQYLVQLCEGVPDADTRIVDALIRETEGNVDALIRETEGNVDGALRILRDIGTPDGRATLFGTLVRTRGAGHALSWFDEQVGRDDPSFLTGLGWSNVAVSLAKMGRWEEAANCLAAAAEHREAWPELVFREGIINVAMLCPNEWRQYALETNPCYTRIQPIEGPEADRRRSRAKACFERAKDLLFSIDQGDHAQMAQDCLLWLRLTDLAPEVANKTRQDVQEGMQDGSKAVHLLPVARTLDIEFDDAPLEGYLLQRERTGGLDGRERLARLFLAERKLAPGDFSELLEREESRFSQVVHKSSLAGMRTEALAKDGQFVKAREVLEAHRDTFIEHDYDRLRALIDTHAGSDPHAQFEALYQQTGDLIDLNNLINHLRRVGDWAALLPLLQELFTRERTLANALQLIEAMRRQPQPDYTAILEFLEANQDLVERDLDLASERAWALSHVGRLKDAEVVAHAPRFTRG